MPSFGKGSRERLATAHPLLQRLAQRVVQVFDCSVICGHRNEADQTACFLAKASKVKWPQSKHNEMPSAAIDMAPYPINFNDLDRVYFFAGFVLATAREMGVRIRWGGDWDGDTEVNDQTFNDLLHYELLPTKKER